MFAEDDGCGPERYDLRLNGRFTEDPRVDVGQLSNDGGVCSSSGCEDGGATIGVSSVIGVNDAPTSVVASDLRCLGVRRGLANSRVIMTLQGADRIIFLNPNYYNTLSDSCISTVA
ncbi:hypothetical protein GOBAR_AA32194 [Gossypium barbadense]|uniref:Uncharacterized protein n=1 Tax=Gossypium barbadense TaxID=3634 RepID=A0A2P5WBP6_GOSBA|nr:hypothetical protein GOBAR_AA32194 [Gossypium barbadense]